MSSRPTAESVEGAEIMIHHLGGDVNVKNPAALLRGT